MAGLTAIAKSALGKLSRTPKCRPHDRFVEDNSAAQGGYYVEMRKPTLEYIRGRMSNFEASLADVEKKVRSLGKNKDAEARRLRLKLAEMRMGHLASCILLWHCGRTGDIQRLVVNWDVREVGSYQKPI